MSVQILVMRQCCITDYMKFWLFSLIMLYGKERTYGPVVCFLKHAKGFWFREVFFLNPFPIGWW